MSVSPCDSCAHECPEGGCAAWRRWFVENWNENIYIGPKPRIREAFRYEHPDREREMEAERLVGKNG